MVSNNIFFLIFSIEIIFLVTQRISIFDIPVFNFISNKYISIHTENCRFMLSRLSK